MRAKARRVSLNLVDSPKGKYFVCSTTNNVTVHPGDYIDEQQVEGLIGNPYLTVVISAKMEQPTKEGQRNAKPKRAAGQH